MNHVGHFIAGELLPADDGSQIFNPSNGKPTAIAVIAAPALAGVGAVEKIRRHDLEVVVGRMGEGAPPVAVAQRPDARHSCAKLVVDFDVAALVQFHPGTVEPEIVGVGSPPRGEE